MTFISAVNKTLEAKCFRLNIQFNNSIISLAMNNFLQDVSNFFKIKKL